MPRRLPARAGSRRSGSARKARGPYLQGRRTRSRPQQLAQISGDRGRFVAQLPPGDSRRPPALDEENPIPLAVPLERSIRPVPPPPVELDDEPLPGPHAVGFEQPSP